MQHKPVYVALLSLLLAACGTTPNLVAQPPASPDTLLTVPLNAATTNEQLVQQYGGYVALKTNTFALIANPTRQPLQAQGRDQRRAQPNRKVVRISPTSGGQKVEASGAIGLWGNGAIGLWGNGAIGLWGNGAIGLWGNGAIGLWGNGSYAGLPANTQSWLQIGLDVAHSQVMNPGNTTTIAVIDSGIDLSHPMFANGRLTATNTWKDFVDGDSSPQEVGNPGQGAFGHGTEVAGIAVQIAPGAQIMPLRVLDTDGSGDVLNVASAIVWATDHGADVINLSLGTSEAVDAITQAIAYANSQNVLVVAAAGNTNQSVIDYPAAEMSGSALNVSVGSVSSTDTKSSFSSYSVSLGLMAPGEQIAGPFPGERMTAWSGTSMSAPVVAGALALGLGEGFTPQVALSTLKSTATKIDTVAGNQNYAGRLGAGRIDLASYLRK